MSEGARRLAAVVVADVVGYSSMMERDEAATLSKVLALRDDLVEPEVSGRGGRIVKTTGDGLIAEFGSVVNAVGAVVAVQEALGGQNDDGGPMRMRVGIHLCDVVERDGDIYGDGVNVAARLEQAAEPGGILISDAAHGQLAGHYHGEFTDIGILDLKNISRPVRGWCWGHTSMESHRGVKGGVSGVVKPGGLPAGYKRTTATQPPLLERETELEQLTRLLEDLPTTGGKVVLIRGEAGIGKTALVRAFLDQADGAHVLFGRCDDLMTARPLGPIWDIARHEPALGHPLRINDRSGLLDVLLDMLERPLRPSVIVVEDTQWADEATFDVIHYLGRRITETNSLLLLTYREGELDFDHPLRAVIGELPADSVIRIRPEGLSPEAVSILIGGSGLDAETVFAATDGNPFLTMEMASVGGGTISWSVRDTVTARLVKLPPRSRETVKILSVMPQHASETEVFELTQGAEGGGLRDAERQGLLSIEDGLVGFRHELIRRAVEESLTSTERREFNRLVLERLPADTDPARLVHHAYEANDVDRLIELAPEAARAAVAVGSHREALDHFRQLRPHLDLLPLEAKGPILHQWAWQEQRGDNIGEALTLNQTARAHYRRLGDPSGESRALAQLAHCYEFAGQRARAEQTARQAVEVLGEDPDPADLARALEVNAYLALMSNDVTAVHELVDRTLEVAGPDVEPRILIRCLNHHGSADNMANYPAGVADLDEARERAQAVGDWSEEVRALNNYGEAALEVRDLSTAADHVGRARAVFDRHDSPGGGYIDAVYARILELNGRWAEAEELARNVLNRHAIAQMVALPVLGAIQARKGQATSKTTLGQAWEMAVASDEFQRVAPAAAAAAEHSWISGDSSFPAPEIRAVMETGVDFYRGWPSGAIALWLWKLGELNEVPEGIAEPYRLIIEGQPLAAAEMWAEIGCPYEQAIALSCGDTTNQLEALHILDQLGATAVAAKLRQALRDQGVSVPPPKQRAQPRVGLTPRQTEVLLLIAEGLSNADIADRLFLSPRTVEHHVSAVLSKLDATNRDQAVAIATKQGMLTTS